MAEVFDLGIDWDDKNSLSQIIANLEKVLAAQKKMIENNAKLSSSYDEHLSKIKKQFTEINKEIKKTNSEIKNATSAGGIEQAIQKNDKLRSTYKMLKDEVVKLEKERVKAMKNNAKVNEQKIREQQMAAREKKAIRERIKDEQALNTVRNRTIKSQKDLREVTNALVRLRDRLDTTTVKGRKKWDEYTRAIANNTQKLKDNDAQIGRFQRNVGNYQSALSGVGRTFTNLASAAGIALGAFGAFRVIGNAVGLIRDFEKANANLAAVLGTTRKEITALTEDAKRLGESTVFTASEVTGLQTEFAKLGFPEQDILNMTEATLNLAVAAGTELPRAAEVAGATVRSFGLSSQETARITDVMASSFSGTALDMEKFSTAMSNVGTTANLAGVSVERTTAMLGVLVNRGMDASTAGTTLRNVFLNTAKAGLTFEEAMEQINNSTDKNVAAMELFGVRGATTGNILASTGEEVEKLNQRFEEAGGTAERMAKEQMNTLDGALKALNSKWEGLILGAGDSVGVSEKLSKIIKFLTDNLEDIVKVIITGVQAWASYKTATVAARVATAAYTLVTRGAAIAQALFSANTTRAAAAMKLLNSSMAMNPIGLIVAGLTTLATAMSLFGDSTEDASDEVNKLSESEQRLIEIQEEKVKQANNEIGALKALVEQIKRTNNGSKERKKLIDQLNSQYGTTLKNIKDEKKFIDQLTSAYTRLVGEIKRKIALEAQQEQLAEVFSAQQFQLEGQVDTYQKLGITLDSLVSKFQGTEAERIFLERNLKAQGDIKETLITALQTGEDQRNRFQRLLVSAAEQIDDTGGGRLSLLAAFEGEINQFDSRAQEVFNRTQAVIDAIDAQFPSITGEGGDGGSTNAARERTLTFLDQLEERLKRNLEEREKLVDLQTPENDPYLLALKSEATELTNQISKVKELIELKKESADVDETKIKLLEAEIKKFEQLNTAGEVVEYRQDGSGSTRRTGRIDRLKIEREFELETIQIKLDAIEKERKSILGRYADAGELSAEDLEAFKNTESQKVQLINKRKELEFDAEIEDIQKRKYDAEIAFYNDIVDGKKKSDEEILQAEKEFNEEMISLKLEEIDAELRLYDVESLEYKKLLAEKLKLEKKFTDSKNEEEENRRQAIKDTQQLVQKGFEDGLRLAQQYANEDKQLAEDALNQQKSNVDLQKELAKQGLDNTLAFEQQLQKEKEKAILEEAKRLERIKRIETYYNLFAAYANDPETSPAEAAGKALIQLGIGQAIAAKLEDGGVIADAVAQQNGGILRGASHRNGGILIEAEGNEGIFSKKEMSNIGRDRFYALKNVFGDRRLTDDYFNKANHELLHVSMPVVSDNSKLEQELKSLNAQISELPNKMPRSQQWIDKHGNLVTREEFNNSVKQTTQKRRFNR